MAFNADYLTLVPGGSNTKPSIWIYKTADTAADVDTAGYFPVGYGFKIGDILHRVTVTNLGAANEAFSTAGLHVVSSGDKQGTVDVNDTLAITATDTD